MDFLDNKDQGKCYGYQTFFGLRGNINKSPLMELLLKYYTISQGIKCDLKMC